MLSMPTGLPPQVGQNGMAGLVTLMTSASMSANGNGLVTVAKLPDVFGTVPIAVNTGLPASVPVSV